MFKIFNNLAEDLYIHILKIILILCLSRLSVGYSCKGMDPDFLDIRIKSEELEIYDIDQPENEEELEDMKPYIGFEDREFDVILPHFNKEPFGLEIESGYDVGTESVKTTECVSDIGIELLNINHKNSISGPIDNSNLKSWERTDCHRNFESEASRQTVLSVSCETPAKVAHPQTKKRKGKMVGQRNILKKKMRSANTENSKDTNKKSTQPPNKNVKTSDNLITAQYGGVNKENNFVLEGSPEMTQNQNSTSEENAVTLDRAYSCSHCDYKTCFRNMLAVHQSRHKKLQPWACSKCSSSFGRKFSLNRHVKLVHEKTPKIFCNECDFKCSKKVHLKNHMVVHSNKNYFQCSDCNFKHVKQSLVRKHMIMHLRNKIELMCPFCEYRGVKPEYVTKHLEKNHRFELEVENYFGVRLPETAEGNNITSSTGVNSHSMKSDCLNILKKQPIVLLKRCDDEIDNTSNSVSNMVEIHKKIFQDNFFEVAKCGETREELIDPQLLNSLCEENDSSVIMESTLITRNKNTITSVVKVLDNESTQPHLFTQDSVSGIKNKVIRLLKSKHQSRQTESNQVAINEVIYNKKTDSGVKPTQVYKCKECSFVSTWLDQFETHVELHSSKGFACDKCRFIADSQRDLAKHKQLKHRLKKAFKCERCNYVCASSKYLKNHLKCHDKTKRFKCEKCSMSFKSSNTLKLHMSKHEEEKPFACELCDYRTRFKISLRNHMFVHTGETKFVCEICNYKFYVNASLKKHMEVHRISK